MIISKINRKINENKYRKKKEEKKERERGKTNFLCKKGIWTVDDDDESMHTTIAWLSLIQWRRIRTTLRPFPPPSKNIAFANVICLLGTRTAGLPHHQIIQIIPSLLSSRLSPGDPVHDYLTSLLIKISQQHCLIADASTYSSILLHVVTSILTLDVRCAFELKNGKHLLTTIGENTLCWN